MLAKLKDRKYYLKTENRKTEKSLLRVTIIIDSVDRISTREMCAKSKILKFSSLAIRRGLRKTDERSLNLISTWSDT
jgi:hypothetical protein